MHKAKDWNSDFKDKVEKNHSSRVSKRNKNFLKHKDKLMDIWDNMTHGKICIMESPEGEEREQEIQNVFEDNY